MHEVALSLVNDIKVQLARLARSAADAAADKKVTPMEGMLLGMQGMQLATTVLTAFTNRDAAITADMLYVLEHGQLALPDEAVAVPTELTRPLHLTADEQAAIGTVPTSTVTHSYQQTAAVGIEQKQPAAPAQPKQPSSSSRRS